MTDVAALEPVLCFVDTETTSLRHDRRVWDAAVIVRNPSDPPDNRDHEHQWLIDTADLDLGNADLMSLRIGGFYQRHPANSKPTLGAPGLERVLAMLDRGTSEARAMADIERLTRGAIIVAANVAFDADVLGQRMRAHGILPAWDYHILDVEAFAAGALRMPPPWKFRTLLAEFGLTYNDEADRHTALGDARMVAKLYDAALAARTATL